VLTKASQLVNTSNKGWLERGARLGHLAKGLIHGLVGVLALQVALGAGGRIAGDHEAMELIGDQPFGRALLFLVALGLAGYAAWRLIEGFGGVWERTRGGLMHRLGAFGGGLVNAALSVAVFQMALGDSGKAGESHHPRSWVGELLQQPYGEIGLALVGAIIVVVGAFQLYEAYTKKFLQDFRLSKMSEDEQRWVTRAGQAGFVARGVVFPIVGVGLLRAALQRDASETRDTRAALVEIASSAGGQIALALVAVGLLAFALFMVASARYRRITC
jgi:hypothetical protein